MEKEFVTYEQALALKELGFNEECMAGYDKEDNTLYIAYLINAGVQFNSHYYDKAPLKQQVFRWFREEYGYDVDYIRMPKDEVFPITKDSEIKWTVIIYRVYTNDFIDVGTYFNTYEQAENACIDNFIELAKQQKKIDLIAEISGW